MSEVKKQSAIKDMILATISEGIDSQTEKGVKKYGQTLDESPVEEFDWLKMANEELVDACNYFVKEIGRLQGPLVHFRTSNKGDIRHDGTLRDETPSEALDSAVGEYKAVSERDEIIEDLQDEIEGLKKELESLKSEYWHWRSSANNAVSENKKLRDLLTHTWGED